jgi:hypothetical protein
MSIQCGAFGRWVAGAMLVMLPWIASAQSTTTGTIAGTVKDTTGAVLPGVTVEAASPVLIEKTRATVTDAQGNYKILELRPGTYTVTFALPGFSTVKREGLELVTGFAANVSAEMKVGAVEETVTVTGASPVVDVQNVRQQTVMSKEAWDAIPTGKTLASYVQLTLGATMSANGTDVGGSKGDKAGGGAAFEYHGVSRNDSSILVDGMSVNAQTTGGGPWTRTTVNNQQAFEEQTIGSGPSAEQETAGLFINLIPREGGNSFSGNFALNGSSGRLQGTNLNDELIARGVPLQGKVRKLYDAGGGFGGPIKKDRVWFFVTERWWNAATVVPGSFYNATPKPVNGLFPLYTPDVSRPAVNSAPNHNTDVRMTWQINNPHKLAFFMEQQSACNCFFGASATMAAEASQNLTAPYGTKGIYQGSWTWVKGNRWLFTAGNTSFLSSNKAGNELNAASTSDIALRDITNNFYWNNHQDDPNAFGGVCCTPISDGRIKPYGFSHDQKYTASFSTGSHTFKVGARTWEHGSKSGTSSYNDTPLGPVLIGVRGGACFTEGCTPPPMVPATVLLLINPQGPASETENRGGSFKFVTALYAQEQWTLNRMTMNLGVRYDGFYGKFNQFTSVANNYAPSFTFPEVTNSPNWKDINPRVGIAYDLFGNGKTAIKGHWGRFVVHQAEVGSTPSSLLGFAGGTRTWNDSFYPVGDARRGNFVPDCSLTNPATNGECGPLPNASRGLPTAQSQFYDSALLEGWHKRPFVWNSSVSVSQELAPGFAVNVGYFHTANNNIIIANNRAVTPADYTGYCVTAPVDSRLGDVSGSRVCGLYDLNPSKVGQVNNLVTIPSTYGVKPINKYDGVDFALNARFGKGGILSGGVSTAKSAVDNCSLNAAPNIQILGQAAANTPSAGTPRISPYCNSVTDWSHGTQVKLFGNYPLPWLGLNVSGTFLNLAGPAVSASRSYTSAEIAPSLGRALSSGATGQVSVSLLPPNTVYEDRFSQTDVRLTKSIQMGKVRAQGQFDVYNLFNSSAVLGTSSAYTNATSIWPRVSSILAARLFKFGMQLDWK